MSLIGAFVFEFIGSFILTSTYAFQYTSNSPGGWFIMGNALGVIILLGGRVSGAHVNPVITFAFMIRKVGHISVGWGLAYFLAQILGGFIAGLLQAWQHDEPLIVVPILTNHKLVPAMIAEAVGTAILTLMVLVNTEEETSYSRQHWVTALLIGLSLSTAVYPAATASNAVFNPQISIGLELTALVYGATYNPYIKHFYVYIVFPALGGFVAVIFFQYFYKPSHKEALRGTKLSDMSESDRLNP